MSVADMGTQDNMTASEEKQTSQGTSTIIAVVPSAAAENTLTLLKGDTNSEVVNEEESEFNDASDLTREQWLQVL